jgi:2-polyprenyl-3-methyl-5-hydroxy-6-metoxy-1,4-benzoquinol methylase
MQTKELYDADYYFNHLGSTPYAYCEPWLSFFSAVADALITRFSPRRVLDAGCAIGLLTKALQLRGVDAYGVDVSQYAIQVAGANGTRNCTRGGLEDFRSDIEFDLVTCIEVFEHMSPEQSEAAVENLTLLTNTVVFSSTSSDFEEPTHINVQPQEYWDELFKRYGFVVTGEDVSVICPWAKVYRKLERY